MTTPPTTVIEAHFGRVPDPRIARNQRHRLVDILVIAVCGVLCGADTWVDIALFGEAKVSWLRSFLALPNGIPSHDTFGRVFARINPEAFQQCFLQWVQAEFAVQPEQVVAIDGKTARGSRDRANGQQPLHMVSAWAATNRLVLGQVATAAKSNEITAIPLLLKGLDIKGCTVTIDAQGCQKAIAQQIIEQEGDYIFTVKKNQPRLYRDIEALFQSDDAAIKATIQQHETRNDGHGRSEHRKIEVSEALTSLHTKEAWPGLRSVICIEATCTTDTKVTTERRYFISSRAANAVALGTAIREHWGIENRLHWVLDVTMNEDRSRVRKDHGAANFVMLRHITTNILQQEPSKGSIRGKRKRAGWDNDYLRHVLTYQDDHTLS